MGKNNVTFEVNPKKVMIKITKEQAENITSKEIIRDDGTKVRLFTEPEFESGFDRRWQQNVSVGAIVAIGSKVEGIVVSDIAILDYRVRNDDDILIGFVGGDQLVAIDAKTTYHTEDAKPYLDNRRAYVKGDFDHISTLLGVVRGNKMIAFSPYVFLVHKSPNLIVRANGGLTYETTETMVQREVLSASPDCGYKDGDKILIKEPDLFSRHINGREISVCFYRDILAKK